MALDTLHIYTDGGCRGNPGRGAIGIVFTDANGNILKKYAKVLDGLTTNNRAELEALICALDLALEYSPKRILCFSDSKNLIGWASGKFKIKVPEIRKLITAVRDKQKNLPPVEYSHVPRENQYIQIADELLNGEMDKRTF